MLVNKIILSGLIASAISSFTAQATDIVINGDIFARTCQVDADSVNQRIDFGQLRHNDLAAAGSFSDWKPFSFTISNCLVITSVTANFTGPPALINNGLYANTGSAKNVEIEVRGVQDEPLGNGKSFTQTVGVSWGAKPIVWNLKARVYSTNGNATAGTIQSVMQITLTYL